MRKLILFVFFICMTCDIYAHPEAYITITDENGLIWKTNNLPDSFHTQSITLTPQHHDFIDRIYFNKGKSGAVVIYIKQEDEEKNNDLEQAGFSENLDLRFSHAKDDALIEDLNSLVEAEVIPSKVRDYILANKDKAVFSVLDYVLPSGASNEQTAPSLPTRQYRVPQGVQMNTDYDSHIDTCAELIKLIELQRHFNLHS